MGGPFQQCCESEGENLDFTREKVEELLDHLGVNVVGSCFQGAETSPMAFQHSKKLIL